MIQIPFEDIISKIKEKSGMTDDQIDQKINQKLKQLSGLISKEGAAHILANELGIKLVELNGKLQIKNILVGLRDLEIVGRIRNIFPVKEFQTAEGRQGKVASLIIEDETGLIRVTLWHGQTDNIEKIKQGDIVKVVGGYVRDNKGNKEIHLNERSKLVINPEGETVGEYKKSAAERKEIINLKEGDNAVLLGTIIQVFDPKFFMICPECGKKPQQKENLFSCSQHGNIMPEWSYVLNLFLDDGTGNIRTVFFREQVEKVSGKTKQELLNYKDNPEQFNDVKTELLGNIVKLEGRAVQNKFFDRLEFIANSVDMNPDPEQEIKRLEKINRGKP